MKFPRSSGILLHPTSLPGRFGIGDLGPAASEFVDFLEHAGQKLWQVLPLNPTGYGDSPYQTFSAFAGNPLLISFDELRERGVLNRSDLPRETEFPEDRVDFGAVIPFKYQILKTAAQNFFASATAQQRSDFEQFCTANASWLNDYATFMAAKMEHGGVMWTEWGPMLARHSESSALRDWYARMHGEITRYMYWQYEFCRQWQQLKSRGNARGIRIMGDIPIYVALDSSDVWSRPEMFHVDADGRPTKVAGVPPDYFSANG
ncbi:MAG: 4-alpha-glucanotransferase, partial [Acidobacteria bacterium]|nr:4-alpha-glucanotransferase [Acidobacteriota bacterium]